MTLSLLVLTGCGLHVRKDVRAGLPESLAVRRAHMLNDVRYRLTFDLRGKEILGKAHISFHVKDPQENVVLDFKAPPSAIRSASVKYRYRKGHIVFKSTAGKNNVVVEFAVPSTSLHRNETYIYSLFVPDRASETFPCFDQPDIKARYTLDILHPADWLAVSNAPPQSASKGHTLFKETAPLSTYHFAFAAGKFRIEAARREKRRLRMYHLEENSKKIKRNLKEIFDLHALSLRWLENYTEYPYPYEKFDFVLLPGFPFSGMEHPGAVFYRADRLLLDENSTEDDRLRRASAIAHESAHMWFGNLVTMRWFDDVWTKESFASFMADKITAPLFPKFDHELRFLAAHAGPAYAIERTRGSHALHQKLDNLSDAGQLYGGIIYHKSPFVLRQLERIMGETDFQNGLRTYLQRHAFKNAMWWDWVSALAKHTQEDINAFSRAWVYRPGRPAISTEIQIEDEKIKSLALIQAGGVWDQALALHLDGNPDIPVRLNAPRVEVPAARGLPAPTLVFPNADGSGYGRFILPPAFGEDFFKMLADKKPVLRGALWEAFYDAVLEREASPQHFISAAIQTLKEERNEIILDGLIGSRGKLVDIFWNTLTAKERAEYAPRIEMALIRRLDAPASSIRTAIFKGYRALASSPEGIKRLAFYWSAAYDSRQIVTLDLSEKDLVDTALLLSVHGVPHSEKILKRQSNEIKDPLLKKRLTFLAPAASVNPKTRDAFFKSLKNLKNRKMEPWVIEALELLHHPQRRKNSEKYILPTLKMLQDIHETGDIFFPAYWLKASLSNYNSISAQKTVERFLSRRPRYPLRLKRLILQAADPLFRRTRVIP